jgi:hypothetical protein
MKKILSTLFAACLFSFVNAQQYGLMTKTGSFLTGNNTSYVQTVSNLEVNAIDNSKSTEIAGTGNIFTTSGNVLYYVNFSEPRIYKFQVNPDNTIKQLATVLLPDGDQLPHIVDLYIENETTGWALSYNVFNVYKINLTNMTIAGVIDMSATIKPNYETSTPEEIQIRDGKLFVAMWYGSGLQNAIVIDTAFVAVCDIATMKFEKLIKDSRTLLVGYGSSAIDAMFIDEQGDLYVAGSDLIDGAQGIKDGGILRIKKGETEFDPTYFLNLDQLIGKKTLGTTYLGNGIMYTTAYYPEARNPVNPLSVYIDPVSKFWKVNLITKEIDEVEETPHTRGLFHSWLTKIGDKYLMPIGAANSDNYLWLLDANTNKATRKIQLSGEPFGLFKVNRTTTSVRNSAKINTELIAFPNPAQNELWLTVAQETPGPVSANLYDLQGRLLQTLERTEHQKDFLFTFDISNLTKGQYSIQVIGKEGLSNVRFVKQ